MSNAITRFTCEALLFDLDGVLVDSIVSVEHTWRVWAARHGLELETILRSAHGRRAFDTVQLVAPHLDAAAEVITLSAQEANTTQGLSEVPGAHALLAALPPNRWAVVTSGDRAVAEHRLQHVGLPLPAVMVCGDEVTNGKPDPEGYLAAAAKLGVAPANCVVVEDAPSGIEAARNAGMRVIAVATTHKPEELRTADLVIDALSALIARVHGDGLELCS
ncbi:MAG TPA: HAD family hydrolase [Gemmatimonadaceae bacterium]|nr:HAD family hydrolase [Gemmatimonadaceae bacterium]